MWAASQRPEQHQRWDLRFQRIEYLPKGSAEEPQRFRYATAGIDGVGISVGERVRPDGAATSALCFSSKHPVSAIAHGSGYWRYVPTDDGLRFLTGYDYVPRNQCADLVFRPLMGWATAWSFDRLRLWLERGITPEASFRRAAAGALIRALVVLALVGVQPITAIAAVPLAFVLPPLPSTPAARRCLRRAPDRAPATPPRTLATLENS